MFTKIPVAALGAAAVMVAALPAVAQKNVAGAQLQTQAATVNPELVFEAIASCRAFDTHATQPLIGSRAFAVSGPDSLKKQGGPKAGCGIPVSAAAVAISLTTNDATDSGTIAGYPRGLPVANAVAAYNPSLVAVSGAILGLNNQQLALTASVGSVQVVGDVSGYYAPQIEGYVNADGSIYSSTARVLSVAHSGVGEYQITLDRVATTCAALITPGVKGYVATGSTSGFVLGVHTSALASTWTPTDTFFNFTVTC